MSSCQISLDSPLMMASTENTAPEGGNNNWLEQIHSKCGEKYNVIILYYML